MTTDQFISVRETAQVLGISEKKVMDMIEAKELQAYRIAGQFLRLKKFEVINIKKGGEIVSENVQIPYTMPERVKDFFYFNDFYLISGSIIIALIYVIFYK